MRFQLIILFTTFLFTYTLSSTVVCAQTNPLWKEDKVKNYLPHMTTIEVDEFLDRSDIVIIPVGAIEQHSAHLPCGTDFINGVELSKLIAQERDVLVCPILLAGQSSYHMGFVGSITLSAETILQVHLEAVQSLIKNGFKRFIILNSHGGNKGITTLLVDQINQTTPGVAVTYSTAIAPFLEKEKSAGFGKLDRHAGTPETSRSMYLTPNLVQIEKAEPTKLNLPKHLEHMVPDVVANEPTAKMLFLAEALKPAETGKQTSMAEMSETGVWGEVDPKKATLEKGRQGVLSNVQAATQFIDRWNELVPYKRKN